MELFSFEDGPVESNETPANETAIAQLDPDEPLCEIIPLDGELGVFALRPYQMDAVRNVYDDLSEYQSTIIVMPTGCGKTVCFADVAIRWPEHLGRVLVLAHREELIDQAVEKIGLHLDQPISVEMGQRREIRHTTMFHDKTKVLVASVQTLVRDKRREHYGPKEVGLLIIDECFVPGTLIDGYPIELIRVGDIVRCFDHLTGKIVTRLVTETTRKECRSLLRIRSENGHEIVCTPNHPVFTLRGYVSAGTLTYTDRIMTTNYGLESDRVTSVQILKPGTDGEFERLCPCGIVYNFGVKDHHNYFANGILVHNCHHSPASSYRKVIKHFIQLNPQLRIIGVTAFAERADKKALGDIFQKVSFEMDLATGIDEGWLVNIDQKFVVVENLNFSKVGNVGGDFNQRDLANVMMGGNSEIDIHADRTQLTPSEILDIEEQERMLHEVAVPTIREAQGRSTLVFCVTKAHAERLCEIFQRYPGVTASFVTDATPKEERQQRIKMFKASQIQILVNVGVLLEGFDSCNVAVIAMARPTKSKSVYVQAVGRGTRPLTGLVDKYHTAEERKEAIRNSSKPWVTVLDFVGASGKHKLIDSMDILGGDYEEDVIEAAKEKLRNGEFGITTEILEKTKTELDEKKRKILLERQERERLERDRAAADEIRRKIEAERRAKIRAEAEYKLQNADLRGAVVPQQVGAGMFRGGSSDSQVKFLIRLGVSHENACRFNQKQAAVVINEMTARTGGKFIMRYGKYCGHALNKLPSGYVDWMRGNMTDKNLLQNIDFMKQERAAMGNQENHS